MKYLALLRSINVGGKNIIKMADLKAAVEESGFSGVSTFIQSGNVIFNSAEPDIAVITQRLGNSLLSSLKFSSLIIVKSLEQMKQIVSEAPAAWEKDDLRKYLAFVSPAIPIENVIREFELKEGVDFVEPGPGVVYMSTILSGLTKSRLSRIISKKVYRDMTMRNYDTTRKILALMDSR
jgi:uncharacterized protein (DUF1697 family)